MNKSPALMSDQELEKIRQLLRSLGSKRPQQRPTKALQIKGWTR